MEYANCGSLYNYLHDEEQRTYTVKNSLHWMYQAAKALEDGEYSKDTDIYSFGIVFWEVMTRKKPFPDLDTSVEEDITNDFPVGGLKMQI
ncbi:GH18207 [Drosophila grimshawi]|uniref:GH18207 n=1 Tax=Drosophila grimshawi TaxID=7222 RepID=B4JFT6_DROGR|nr:GH18207 [Drosophila grimshawi]